MGPRTKNVVRIAKMREGKSESCLLDNAPKMRIRKSERPAIVMLDPPGSMAKAGLAYAIRHALTPHSLDGEPDFIYDMVAQTSGVPGYPVVTPSTNEDPDQREAENRNTIEEVKALLVAAEGKIDTQGSMMIDEGLTDALKLYLHGNAHRDFSRLQHCFRPTPIGREFLASCTDQETRERFEAYHEMNPRDWAFQCRPAVTRLKRIAESVHFRKRCRPTFDMRAFLNRGGILMLDGESRGNLSRTDLPLVFNLVMLNVIQLARNGLTRPVIIIIDEGANTGILNLHVARALAEAGKWGLQFDISIQNPLSFSHPEIGDSLFQNCGKVYAFRQINPDAVAFVARMFAQPTFSPMVVHYVEERIHHVDMDPEKIPTKTVTLDATGQKRTVTEGFTYRARRQEVVDKVERYKTGDILEREMQQVFSSLGVGQCRIIDDKMVTTETVQLPMLPKPWDGLWISRHPRIPLADEKRRLALEFMRQRPEYQTPVSSASASWTPPSTDDVAARLAAGEL